MRYKFLLLLAVTLLFTNPLNASSSKDIEHLSPMTRAAELALLDSVLSPFEDMTEYALACNGKGVLNSLQEIQKRDQEVTFKDSFSAVDYIVFKEKLNQLTTEIKLKHYNNVALLSTAIFHYNVIHFKYAKLIKEQIIIENLDYMGYQTLALLKQKKIDYKELYTVQFKTMELWESLKPKVKDKNLVDSFDLLFHGLKTSSMKQDVDSIKIFASLDLTLVDILEKPFQ